MKNKQIKLDGVIIPYVINNDGIEYYPIKYIMEQFLSKSNVQLYKKDNFKEYVERYMIDYSFKNTVPQETYCMNRNGWIEYLKTCHKNQNKNELKVKRFKSFCNYIGFEFKDESINHYDAYLIECIKDFKSKNPEVDDKHCVKCGRKFPNSYYFFNKDKRVENGIVNVCRGCEGEGWLTDNKINKYIFTTFGLKKFEEFIKDNQEFVINYALNSEGEEINISKIYEKDKQKHVILEMCKRLLQVGKIEEIDLSLENIKPMLNIKDTAINKLTNNKMIEYCIPDIRIRPWKCKKYKLGIIARQEGIEICKRFIREMNVQIEDKFNYNGWDKLIRKCRLSQFNNDILGFVVDLYDKKYAGYLFHITATNYYKDKSNLIFDMKYLVEKDLCVPIKKIPLYVTKYTLKQKSNTLYNLLRKENRIFKDLFEWIDACYPDEFIRSDFDLNPYRSRFDSLEEAQVYEELTKIAKGVIYNPRDDENRVEIMGMIPDFIIHTNKGCYLTEYFGLYSENTGNSARLQNYMRKHDIKINKYKELESLGYKNLFIYPKDLEDDFEGLKNKVKNII